MSRYQLSEISSKSNPLSEEASNLFCRIPRLLRRLHDLEDEEARLNAQARQLFEPQLSMIKDGPPTSVVSTPVSMQNYSQLPGKGTTLHIGPGNMETPSKALLLESLALTMSIKSKRKGRIFLRGDSTEFGERK